MKKELGKIIKAEFGFGGYQDAMTGLSFEIGGQSWAVSDFWGGWATEKEFLHENATTLLQKQKLGAVFIRIGKLLADAKVTSVSKLAGTPVEVTFDGNVLKEWRVLTEVL